MNNQTILLEVRQRLNKLSSNDFDNIESWMILGAFNRSQALWSRRNLHGENQKQEGDEQSTSRIDDMQVLITSTSKLLMNDRQTFYETATKIPDNYLRFKRISCNATSSCCKDPRPMVVYLGDNSNVDITLRDKNKKPSFDYAETFATFSGGNFKIYTNGEFVVQDVVLTYYRQPTRIQITGVKDMYTGLTPTADVLCDFNDDLIELLIDEMAKTLATDIESMVQRQSAQQAAESNN